MTTRNPRSQSGKRRDRIEILNRRMSFLNLRINEEGGNSSSHYWRAEVAALRWAIGLCEAEHTRLENEREERTQT